MKNEGSLGQRRAVIQAILQYLIKNPDAKDTKVGIRKWWLSEECSAWKDEVIEEGLTYLVKSGWLKTRPNLSPKAKNLSEVRPEEIVYGLNKKKLRKISEFLDQL